MAIPDQPSDTTGDELLRWRTLYDRSVRRSRYKAQAKEVADSLMLNMVVRMRDGRKPPTCREPCCEERRVTVSEVNSEVIFVGCSEARELNPPYESPGGSDEIETLIDQFRQGKFRRKDLAVAIGVSERTLRYRFQTARSLRPE